MPEEAIRIDTKGLKCPMPMLRTKKALAKMEAGQVVEVEATDPHAGKDLRQFCEQTGNKFLGEEERDGVFYIRISRKG